MAKKDCLAGQKWDNVVNTCVPKKAKARTETPTGPPRLVIVDEMRDTAPATEADSVIMLGPALWGFVVLAVLGSILVLALWLIIYRRQTRPNSTPDTETRQERLQKTGAPVIIFPLPTEGNGQGELCVRAAEMPSPCAHLHLVGQTGSKWEEDSVALAKHCGNEGDRGLPACNTVMEHKIPLPATELGGTALVTTKTL